MAETDSPLTQAQREIMEVFWDKSEATVADVRKVLSAKRDVARSTVQTMIARLEERGWLTHREVGQTFVYSAARPRKTALGARVSQIVDKMFAGSTADLVTALFEYRGLSPDEADRIRTMIDHAETKKKHPKGKRDKS